MITTQIDRGEVLQSQLLNTLPGVEHFSTLRTCQEPERDVWMPHQVHSAEVWELTVDNLHGSVPDADAVITRLPNQWIGVRTADCVPVLLVDTTQRLVAAVHAGWRGTVAHIVSRTVQQMKQMGCHPADLYAMIGPSIGPEAFEVGEEVAEAFGTAGRADCIVREAWGPLGRQRMVKPHVDLWQSNVMDLMDEGLSLDHIDCSPWCTFTNHDRLFSARREGIGTGRIVSAVRIVC